jgi:2-oxoisovalerate dehydrogenase E1 component
MEENQEVVRDFTQIVIDDYRTAIISREASLAGRKEVLSGKGSFGIFGDGKEIVQIALAKTFKKGDFRTGYYRDQTLMMSLDLLKLEGFFAQLYANAEPGFEPASSGRQMNNHFSSDLVDENGDWLDHTEQFNTAADISSTAGQMPRAVGLALASKIYKKKNADNKFSKKGNEVVFATIGDASTSEGHFWESINAAGVQKLPIAFVVYDDGYGISVPKKYQTTKESISEVLSGFQLDENGNGFYIFKAKAWDYVGLYETFENGINLVRENHIPAIFHITDVTQPQGHSTSGSHERYKSEERLKFEQDFDGIVKMRAWLLENGIATEEAIVELEKDAKKLVNEAKRKAWADFNAPIKINIDNALILFEEVKNNTAQSEKAQAAIDKLKNAYNPTYKNIVETSKIILRATLTENNMSVLKLRSFVKSLEAQGKERYSTNLTSETKYAAKHVKEVKAVYAENALELNGFEILNKNFDNILATREDVYAFGEDVGKIGDVNQAFAGLQEKYTRDRVFDTGIRELTIMGQALGMAMRGLRPIAEIQYLDYLIYGLQPLSDDVATLTYRTNGKQKAPVIIRTRGHRLEGIWHTGSPMGMMINSLRGMNILVPRNMTQAAGFYNTMLQSDEPAIIVECLNGYRLKEKLPENLTEFTVPLGKPEILKKGTDITLVTYGSIIRVADVAIEMLAEAGISVEMIDVQTLLPFDVDHSIVESVKETNRVAFLDEDVPGGASAYMMQQVLEIQGGYNYLDSEPITISAKAHRAAYGPDGDYFSKPNPDEIFEAIYKVMNNVNPEKYPDLY